VFQIETSDGTFLARFSTLKTTFKTLNTNSANKFTSLVNPEIYTKKGSQNRAWEFIRVEDQKHDNQQPSKREQ